MKKELIKKTVKEMFFLDELSLNLDIKRTEPFSKQITVRISIKDEDGNELDYADANINLD